MHRSSNLVLPYEPEYTAHWESDRQRQATREWVRRRERELTRRTDSPSIVPGGDEPERSSE